MTTKNNSWLPHPILGDFDISKYDECSALNITGWSTQLQWRKWWFEESLTEDDITDILECPLSDVADSNEIIPENEGIVSVADTAIYSIFILGEEIQREIKWARPLMEKYNEASKHALTPIPNELITSFDSEIMKSSAAYGSHQFGHISVDLSATDGVILESFKSWLGTRREEMANYYETNERVKKFTQKDFAQWTNKKVLPYLDIQILGKHFGFSTPYHVIGELLFPDEVEVDTTERIRKVVNPAAMSLMKDQLLDQLRRPE